MTQATVKSLRIDKGFGFVTQNDGHDAFLHVSAVGSQLFNRLAIGLPVQIETGTNEKGLFVKSLSILPKTEIKPVEARFTMPDGFIKTTQESPSRGTVFYRRAIQSDYFRDPEEAEKHALDEIKKSGANALLGAKMVQEKKKSGNYFYRVFSMKGTAALVMDETHSTGADTLSLDEAKRRGSAIIRRANNVSGDKVAYDNNDVATHDNEQSALGIVLIAIGVMIVLWLAH